MHLSYQSYVTGTSFPHQEGTSPPEAAIEATPETTPIKVGFVQDPFFSFFFL